MPAYAIFIRNKMTDPEEMAVYAGKARAAKGEHQYTPLTYYGACETWEGESAEGVVILRFADMDAARKWYRNSAYQEAKTHRDKAGDYRVILTDGIA